MDAFVRSTTRAWILLRPAEVEGAGAYADRTRMRQLEQILRLWVNVSSEIEDIRSTLGTVTSRVRFAGEA